MAQIKMEETFRDQFIHLTSKMKGYEGKNDPLCSEYVIIRCDMKSSRRLIKELRKPFDENLTNAMRSTMEKVHLLLQPTLSYTQSDEISFIFFEGTELWNLRRQKITSLVASQVSVHFNFFMKTEFVVFDCRVFNVPSKEDCFEYLLWRNYYMCQNYSIGTVARNFFSTEELFKKNLFDMLNMIREKTDILEYPAESINGTFMKTVKGVREEFNKTTKEFTLVHTRRNVTSSASFLMKHDYSNKFFKDFFLTL